MSRRHRLTKEQRKKMIDSQVARLGRRGLARVVERNIATICDIQERMRRERTLQDKVADLITSFSGSMLFVYLHAVWFGIWILVNLGATPFKKFDPFPFGLLTMIVSLEAIFLSTFLLISQNRMSEMTDKRADLDLQINLLAEYEITRLLNIADAIANHLGLEEGDDPEVEDLKNNVSPEKMMEAMDEVKKSVAAQAAAGAPPAKVVQATK